MKNKHAPKRNVGKNSRDFAHFMVFLCPKNGRVIIACNTDDDRTVVTRRHDGRIFKIKKTKYIYIRMVFDLNYYFPVVRHQFFVRRRTGKNRRDTIIKKRYAAR